MKLLQIASSFAALFYAGAVLAGGSKPPMPVSVPEPSVIGLISLGVVAVFIASRFKK